ncbi:ATP phosphoribosyltransferase regulatory subunit [Loigolactobacillus binensis]|uniref:ATP phosphoribosyltransferase regulatory subunit n=1 Tax=Loigolactobacillus binensis TaxID=2559922 RepID=A0ABW3EAN6_9LACO|nr:ATP phosphoribosyltransferase regulatory subunit [Loigolactobacillus binensis]
MFNRNLPIGTRDEFGALAQAKEKITDQIQTYFRKRGFQKLTTPLLEYKAVFSSMEQQTYQPYQMLDEHGETLVLRPDLTLPVARVMSTTGIKTPVKWYYSGEVFRVKRRLSGSYNQQTQAGIEIIGYRSLKAEWECLTAAIELCQQQAVNDLHVELGHARFVKAVLQALPLNTLQQATLQQALFSKNLTAYQAVIAPLSTDPFYPFLQTWPWLFGDFAKVLDQLKLLPEVPELQSIMQELAATQAFLTQQFPQQRIELDLSIESPQAYYTGMIFHGYSDSTAEFLFSGGRYDQLLSSFQNTLQPAVGLAFEVDQLAQYTTATATAPTTLIYFDAASWQAAQQALLQNPASSLCLAETKHEAEQIAQRTHSKLLDVTEVQP